MQDLIDKGAERTLRTISGFAELPSGWHYGQGGPIAADVLDAASRMIPVLLELGTTEIEAFPAVDGHVLLTGMHEDRELDVMCRSDGTFDVDILMGPDVLVQAHGVAFDDVRDQISMPRSGIEPARTGSEPTI